MYAFFQLKQRNTKGEPAYFGSPRSPKGGLEAEIVGVCVFFGFRLKPTKRVDLQTTIPNDTSVVPSDLPGKLWVVLQVSWKCFDTLPQNCLPRHSSKEV